MKSIFNNNEYFSDHYLNASLAGDCKELLDKWTAAAKQANAGLSGAAAKNRTPNELLKGDKGLRSKWERTRAESFSEDTVGAWAHALLTVLGYTPQEQNLTILLDGKDEYSVPCMLATPDALNPRLVAFVVPGTDDDAMQLPSPQPGKSWAQLIDDLFNQPQHPRWCLFIQGGCVTLIDYNKWFDKRTLTFCFDELYGAQVDEEYRLTAALLHADALCPHTGSCLLDTLTDNSHKNAHAVSTDLKKALQECIQLLGNEYVWYKRHQTKDAVYAADTDEQAKQIALECLRFMYRLLFCFYLESRPELRFLPMGAEPYLRGYSVDFLRDCEEIQLDDEQARNGYFLDASLRQLFDLIYKGREVSFSAGTVSDDFEIAPLKSHLFDPERTPLLSKAHFRNVVLQDIIRLLSIGGHGKSGRGRISYASLGLNQLGAVYENLLAYSGFFARDVLYEVKPAGEKYDSTVHAFFVTEEELQEYTEEERAKDSAGHYIKHDKGEFIYRLAGRNRKNSASYYTPESLTKCTVQFSLKELLKDKCADDILNLKVCEMAVGSAAFLNEAINQLAEAYLRLKQKETGLSLSPDMYGYELQRVKMYIADRNVVGVDLNGTAVELAAVSLWLNTIFEGAFVPWFGMQLHHGNSLIGCKRAYWHTSLLRAQGAKDKKARWDGQTPTAFDWEIKQRPAHSVYHWLVPDAGMANYSHKNIKKYCKAELAQISAWRKEFMLPFSAEEIELALSLSDAADKLWQQHIQDIADLNRRTTDELTVWPHEMPANAHRTSTQEKDKEYKQSIGSETSAYQRLKLAMDYWCALWFWPIEDAANLPSRIDFLMDMHQILNSTVQFQMQGELDFGEPVQQQVQGELVFHEKAISAIIKESSRLSIVDKVRRQQHFFHWELSCAHIFHERAGFDLIVGNPPWIKVEFEEADLLSEVEPIIIVRDKEYRAERIEKIVPCYIDKNPEWGNVYLHGAQLVDACKRFLNAELNYPILRGLPANLYMCFVTRAWEITHNKSNVGFVHSEDFFTSANAGIFREHVYERLKYHFQFQNALLMFPEVGHRLAYSANIYGAKEQISFDHICNLFSTKSLEGCYHTQITDEEAEDIKNKEGKWSIKGHPDRVIRITEKELATFAKLLDKEGTAVKHASLPRLHTLRQLNSLQKIANYHSKISSLGSNMYSSEFWNETGAPKEGIIKRSTGFSKDLILSGPHIFVANPCYKTPRQKCIEKADYDLINLETIPDEYQSRTNYVQACSTEEYEHRSPHLPWNSNINYADAFKVSFRAMLPPSNERTLIGALTCAGTAHVNAVRSVTTAHSVDMLAIASITQSLIGDYYIKFIGATNLHYLWSQLPLLPPKAAMNLRVLALNCLTVHYDAFWRDVWQDEYRCGHWYGDDARLPHDFWANLTPEWQRHCALRNDFARRWALCELDVLVAREIGLTLEELCEAYRIQFPVMRQYEADTWYDRNGRVVFTCSKGLVGLGLDRKTWDSIKEKPAVFTYAKTYTDNTLPTGPVERTIVYEAPFDRRDREVDYATIWAALDAEEAQHP
ncbi:MAG: class I SAM-dependent DNA methyltransferase [Akkermansia sp.]|nr:class I SAM-dependent DNA methyltransferase [Akkermansia sp.]